MQLSTRRDERAERLRRFNRFYTKRLGVLDENFLATGFSLAQGRVLHELSGPEPLPNARDLSKSLALDAGYLSRILKELERRGLIERSAADDDARSSRIRLTPPGAETVAALNARSHGEVGAMLDPLSEADQLRLLQAVETIETLLEPTSSSGRGFVLRDPRPGDLGWVVERHGALYAQEYGWGRPMEVLVAEMVASIGRNFDAARDRAWIAEKDGANAGCVFLVHETGRIARLRLLLVEPWARGLGIGKCLVDECERFARQAGYEKIVLWTHSVLETARRIYRAAGYRCVSSHVHTDFGPPVTSEHWELTL